MWYEYRCNNCGSDYETQQFATIGRKLVDESNTDVLCYCGGNYIRIVSLPQVSPASPDAYWNYTTGSVVSSNRDFEQQLRIGAERMSERLGYEQRFTPVYPSEKRAYTESTANNDGEHGQSVEKYAKHWNLTNKKRTIIT